MKNIGLIKVFTDQSCWVQSVVKRFFSILSQSLVTNDTICIAVSGGTTPFPVYEAIRNTFIIDNELFKLASKTHVFLVDERNVPLTHPASNGGRLNEIWNQLPLHLHIVDFLPSHQEHASLYESKILGTVRHSEQGFPVFDIVILGMGNDGHTASLFPNTDALTNDTNIVSINTVKDKYSVRMTLTFPVLKAAKHKIVLFSGKEKMSLLNQMIAEKQTGFPIEKLMDDENNELEWFINYSL